jgi:calcium-dependent protein kinase
MISKYTLHNVLGEGGYSKVYKCTDNIGIRYACKVLPKNINKRHRIQREILHMQMLKFSPKVVHIVDCGEDENSYYIIQELCRGGSVNQYISKCDYGENMISSVVRGTTRGLCHMHENGIIHSDIKTNNIFFGDLSEDADIKIGDFGLSIQARGDVTLVDDIVGTPYYLAPENLSHKYCFTSDVWGLGVMAYNLLCGKMPFNDKQNPLKPSMSRLWNSILFGTPDMSCGKWTNISEDAKDFIRLCLEKDPKARPSAKDCLTHPWLTKTDINDRFKGQPLDYEPFKYEEELLMNAQTINKYMLR